LTRLAAPRIHTDPEMSRAGEALRVLAELWESTSPPLPPGVPALEAAELRLESGVPALAGEPLLDGPGLVATLRSIGHRLGAVEGYEAAAAISNAVERGASAIHMELLSVAALAGVWDEIEGLATRLDLDGHALITLVDYAARPALRAGALVVRPLLAKAPWGRGTCPACGAPAALSVRTGKEGERSLFCGRCGTGWPCARVRCPVCGERDHRRLGTLHATGEGDYRRAEICESCRCYVKSVAALDPPDADGVLRLDLDTAALDFVAIEHGYRRTTAQDG
jgi:FdhE protein